jgi:hypothetical protein
MADPRASRVEQRRLAGVSRTFSALTISVDPPSVAPPAADARMVALLRRARDRGVTMFDVASARFPARAEKLIANAFPSPDPELGAIVGRSIESLARGHGRVEDPSSLGSLDAALSASLSQSRGRLAPVTVCFVEWDPGAGASAMSLSDLPTTPLTEGDPAQGLTWAINLSAA